LQPATPFFALGTHLPGGTHIDDSQVPPLHAKTVCTLAHRGAADSAHGSPAAGGPESQWTPAPSALHAPGPRQTCATFQTPLAQASSSKPPGAQAEASFPVHPFPTAGGPDG
jgi:hypothetical protein